MKEMSYVSREEFQLHLNERERVLTRIDRLEDKLDKVDNRLVKLETTLLNDYKHKMNNWRIISILASIVATFLGALLSKLI